MKKTLARKLSPDVLRERQVIVSALDAVVPMLGAMVGEHIEVVLHDLTHPENSVLRIANSHVTGRHPGSSVLAGPGNDKALAILAEEMEPAQPGAHTRVFPYPTLTRDGRTLSSGTVIIRDSGGHAFAALCLNADVQQIETVRAMLGRMLPAQSEAPPTPVTDLPDMEVLMNDIIANSVHRLGKPVAKMNKDEKTAAVETMLERGLFMVRGGVEAAARALGVTRFTVYNYLDAVKVRRTE